MADSETSERTELQAETPYPPVVLAVVLTALAGGMGWGIRGQYGHETGAMVPGLLVGLTLAFLYCPHAGSLSVARVVAMTAVGFSFGGAMTYGQTVGLTHDVAARGLDTYWWGMLGLFIKGGLWIGMAGAFLGMGLSGKRYHPIEMMTLMFTLLGLMFLGMLWINEPFEPHAEASKLPAIYFSNFWGQGQPNWKPRPELWGGFLFVWAGLVMYTGIIKKDVLARNLALIGILAGGFGFSIGQSIQAHHAWYGPPAFLAQYDHLINWWNAMEITFGLILGFGLAIGVHLNRRRIGINAPVDEPPPVMSAGQEWTLFVLVAAALATWSFLEYRWFDTVGDLALTMGMIPLIAIVGGRCWPYMLAFPLVALPIAGKTLRELSYRSSDYPLAEGWVYWFILPMLVMVLAGYSFSRRGRQGQSGRSLARWGLLLSTWYYFVLNHAIFRFPWPFRYPLDGYEATGRTPSAGVFLFCGAVLTIAVLTYGWGVRREPSSPGPVVPQPLDPEASPAVDQ